MLNKKVKTIEHSIYKRYNTEKKFNKVKRKSVCGETNGGFTKCWLFPQASMRIILF